MPSAFPPRALAAIGVLALLWSGLTWPTCAAERPACVAPPPSGPTTQAPVYGYRVLHAYPHDAEAFTQGLVYDQGDLLEGTGLYGRSSLRRVTLATGAVLQQTDLPAQWFGEGIAVIGDDIYQLTWQEHTAFRYDRTDFTPTGVYTYTTEGWGLTYDGAHLVMSDGSATLTFRDPLTFAPQRTVTVHDGTNDIHNLNELEAIADRIYANIWFSNRIAVIDPASGAVTAWLDLTGLRPPGTDVLNGIAYDATGARLFVTGKFWPTLYHIEMCRPIIRFLPLLLAE